MRKQRYVALVMILLMVLGAGSLFAGAQREAADDRAEIRFTWWGDTARHEKYNAIADLFEEQNPDVTIVREFGGWGDYWDRLATQTAGGNAPDVQGQHLRQVSDYARRGALLPLDEYVEQGIIDLSNFPDPIREAGRLEGQTLMVAQGYTVIGTFYNRAIFDELGVEYPDFRWTWDQYRETLTALREANDSPDFFPAGDNSGGESRLIVYLTQRGKAMFTEDGQIGFDVDDITAWFEMFADFREARLIPDGATSQEFSGVPLEQSMFVRGMTAITDAPFNQLTLFQGAVPEGEELGLAMFPRIAGGNVGEELGASFLAVASTSRHPEVAARFINFFVNDEEAVSIFRLEQGALGSTASNEVIAPLLSPVERRLLDGIQRAAENDDIGEHALPPAGAAEVYQALSDSAQAVQFGQLTPRAAAERFVSRARSILAD